jgi:hypothetical protein
MVSWSPALRFTDEKVFSAYRTPPAPVSEVRVPLVGTDGVLYVHPSWMLLYGAVAVQVAVRVGEMEPEPVGDAPVNLATVLVRVNSVISELHTVSA